MICVRCENALIGAANYCPTCGTQAREPLGVIPVAEGHRGACAVPRTPVATAAGPAHPGFGPGLAYVAMFGLSLAGMASVHGAVSATGAERQPLQVARAATAPAAAVQARLNTTVAGVLETQWAATLDAHRYGNCQKIEDPASLSSNNRAHMYGTIDQGPSRFQAVKVRVEFTCTTPRESAPRRYADFWIVAATDRAIIAYRCARIAEHSVVEADPHACEFEPDGDLRA